jgi:hypothetical protein
MLSAMAERRRELFDVRRYRSNGKNGRKTLERR